MYINDIDGGVEDLRVFLSKFADDTKWAKKVMGEQDRDEFHQHTIKPFDLLMTDWILGKLGPQCFQRSPPRWCTSERLLNWNRD